MPQVSPLWAHFMPQVNLKKLCPKWARIMPEVSPSPLSIYMENVL